jgi:hypothetical protein
VGGFVSVREGQSYGEFHTPKTGQREIPITPPLARLLAPVEQGPKGDLVALNQEGKPWGQYGLARAFQRVRNRVGLDGWSVYSLRHYAITSWLRAGKRNLFVYRFEARARSNGAIFNRICMVPPNMGGSLAGGAGRSPRGALDARRGRARRAQPSGRSRRSARSCSTGVALGALGAVVLDGRSPRGTLDARGD